jgi:hypothetical protein
MVFQEDYMLLIESGNVLLEKKAIVIGHGVLQNGNAKNAPNRIYRGADLLVKSPFSQAARFTA